MTTLPRPRAAPGRDGLTYPQADLVLGRYRLLEQIGSGGHGTVWVAEDRRRPRRVAVKRVPLGGDEAHARSRAQREARAAARLEHPAIVGLLDAGEQDGAHYLVSELVEGRSLAAHYRAGGLGDRRLLAIGAVLADALDHAHERGVVHRDVKPQNVIVLERPADGGVPAKLTDFGIARLADELALTRTGDVIGTFEYMAPEQAAGHVAGPQADLYGLALTIYEGLAGTNPLRGRTVAETAVRIGEVLPPLDGARPDLPETLCAAIDHALDPQPARRGTLAQLGAALDAATGTRAPRQRRLGSGARAVPLALTPRARSLLAACGSGALAGALAATLLGVHGVAAAVLVGALAAALVLVSTAAGWLLLALAAVGWLGAAGQPGSALVLAAALAPVPLLLPARPWSWSAPALAPVLGLLGLAACAPVFAARLGGRLPARAALGALGYWWLAIVETLSGRRLFFGVGAHVAPRVHWQASLSGAVDHALAPLCSDGRLLTAALWALAAGVLPWLVRGRRAQLRLLAALAWATALLVGTALITAHLGVARSPMSVPAAALAAALAFAAWSSRDPSHQPPGVA